MGRSILLTVKGKHHEENYHCTRSICWRVVYRLRILPTIGSVPLRTDHRWQADLRLRLLINGGKRSSSPTAMLDKAVPFAASTPPFTDAEVTFDCIQEVTCIGKMQASTFTIGVIMATRIYKVTYNNQAWLVRASTRGQAIAHVAGKEMQVTVASQDDLVSSLEAGAKVESAKGEA